MSDSAGAAGTAAVAKKKETGNGSAPRKARGARWAKVLSPRNIGAIYVWILIIVLFTLLAPETFPEVKTAKSILNQYSITGIAALSLVIPLAAGYYDLSIGYTLGAAGLFAAHLLEITSLSPAVVIVLTLLACVGVGLLNSLVVIVLRVDSFIGTLATGAILAAATTAISNDQTVVGRVGGSFSNIATGSWQGITLPVLYMLVGMIAIGWLLERTQMGRRFYAMGFERETARLSGIRVDLLGTLAFISSAVIAGAAGLVLTGRVASASPEAGPPYLIPAFSAAFLGATQLRAGRFNPWGTVIAVLMLGTGDVGLLLAGGPIWTPELFEGVVLIAAVALTAGNSETRERLRLLGERIRNRNVPPAASAGRGKGGTGVIT
jgi:ribose transport system permease protein